MDPTTVNSARRSAGIAAISLRSLFFVTFVAACVSRWLAHFGLGIGVLLLWAGVVGLLVGTTFGLPGLFVCLLRTFQKTRTPDHLDGALVFLKCLVAGAIGGFATEAIAFAALASSGSVVQQVPMHGFWQVVWIQWNSTSPRAPTLGDAILVLFPAILGAATNAVAANFGHLRRAPLRYVVCTASTTPTVVTLILAVALLIRVAIAAPRPINVLAVISIFVCWFPMVAAITFVLQLFVSMLWLWIRKSQASRRSRLALWCFSAILILVVSELALHDWAAAAWQHAAHVDVDTDREPRLTWIKCRCRAATRYNCLSEGAL